MTLQDAQATFGTLEINVGVLSYFDRFSAGPSASVPPFAYEFGSTTLEALKAKYDLLQVVDGNAGFKAVVRLAQWVHGRLRPGGSPSVPSSALAIIEHATAGENAGFSCDQYATVLAECCLAVGIPARATNLEPFNPNQGGNHVVVTAWDSDKRKWCFVDAQFCVYYTNTDGIVLDPLEIRHALIQHRELAPSSEYDYYGHWPEEVYRIFLAKNLFSFACPATSKAGPLEPDARRIYLHPSGYDPFYRTIKNQRWYARRDGKETVDFAVTASECAEFAAQAKSWTLTTDPGSFMAAPDGVGPAPVEGGTT